MADVYPPQTRSVDPYSSYDSDNVNVHTRASAPWNPDSSLDNSNYILYGLKCEKVTSSSFKVTRGACIKDDVYIQLTDSTAAPGYTTEIDVTDPTWLYSGNLWSSAGYYYICLDYTYIKGKPAPEAKIQILDPSHRSAITNGQLLLSVMYVTSGPTISSFLNYDPENPTRFVPKQRIYPETSEGVLASADEIEDGRIAIDPEEQDVYIGNETNSTWDMLSKNFHEYYDKTWLHNKNYRICSWEEFVGTGNVDTGNSSNVTKIGTKYVADSIGAILQSTNMTSSRYNEDEILRAILVHEDNALTSGASYTHWLSNNSGYDWEQVTPGEEHIFSTLKLIITGMVGGPFLRGETITDSTGNTGYVVEIDGTTSLLLHSVTSGHGGLSGAIVGGTSGASANVLNNVYRTGDVYKDLRYKVQINTADAHIRSFGILYDYSLVSGGGGGDGGSSAATILTELTTASFYLEGMAAASKEIGNWRAPADSVIRIGAASCQDAGDGDTEIYIRVNDLTDYGPITLASGEYHKQYTFGSPIVLSSDDKVSAYISSVPAGTVPEGIHVFCFVETLSSPTNVEYDSWMMYFEGVANVGESHTIWNQTDDCTITKAAVSCLDAGAGGSTLFEIIINDSTAVSQYITIAASETDTITTFTPAISVSRGDRVTVRGYSTPTTPPEGIAIWLMLQYSPTPTIEYGTVHYYFEGTIQDTMSATGWKALMDGKLQYVSLSATDAGSGVGDTDIYLTFTHPDVTTEIGPITLTSGNERELHSLAVPMYFLEDTVIGARIDSVSTNPPEALNVWLHIEHLGEILNTSLNWTEVQYVRINETLSAPVTTLDEVVVYAKDVAGNAELFVREEQNGTEIQLTTNGKLNIEFDAISSYFKGVRDGFDVDKASNTTLYVKNGRMECGDRLYTIPTTITTNDLATGATVSTWYAVEFDPDEAVSGAVVANCFKRVALTGISYDSIEDGWFNTSNANRRAVGLFYVNSSGNIENTKTDGGRITIINRSAILLASGAAGLSPMTAVSTGINLGVPFNVVVYGSVNNPAGSAKIFMQNGESTGTSLSYTESLIGEGTNTYAGDQAELLTTSTGTISLGAEGTDYIFRLRKIILPRGF